MDVSSSQSDSSQTNQSEKNNRAPFSKYVEVVEKLSSSGGSIKFKCKFCHETKQGTYCRIRAHLCHIPNKGIAGCKKMKQNDLLEMKRLVEEHEYNRSLGLLKIVSLPCHGVASESTLMDKRRNTTLTPLGKAFDNDTSEELDQEIARMFYTAGLSFNLARNPYYAKAFTFVANHNLGGFVPPGYNNLRTTLLDKEKTHVSKLLEPIKKTWSQKMVTIMTDGWSDPQRRSIINFMATTGNGPIFLNSIDCEGEVKDKHFISTLMKEVIDSFGHQNVVQIITDNAANCKGAGKIIEGMYPSIYWTPCVVHTLNLALKNICCPKNISSNYEVYDECHWIIKVHDDAIVIKNFIMNHSMRLSMFNKFSPLKLLSVAETRFASVVIVLKRFKLI